ncbi:MAG: glycosyltransferase family 2 protein [Lachnospirales bacterium]
MSCIIPVYNGERFLKEAINSVVNQSIGFENVQLILINDGSVDRSEKICIEFSETYSNIEYYYKENSGVSSSRNVGMSYAKGKYISFLDADDLLEKNFYNVGINFLENNNIEMVAYPIKNMKKGILSKKQFPPRFDVSRVINVKKEYQLNQFSACSILIKSSAVKGLNFNEKMHFSEDAEFIHKVVLKNMCYGVTNESFYVYRRDNESSTKSKLENLNWYYKDFQNQIIKYSKEKYNYVTKYTQSLCLYELTSFFIIDVPIKVNVKAVFEDLKKALEHIDDEIIVNSKMDASYKLNLLSLKNRHITVSVKNDIYFEIGQFNIQLPLSVNIYDAYLTNDVMYIKGNFPLYSYAEMELVAKHKDKTVSLNEIHTDEFDMFFLGLNISKSYVFEMEVKDCNFEEISFYMVYKGSYFPVSINEVK